MCPEASGGVPKLGEVWGIQNPLRNGGSANYGKIPMHINSAIGHYCSYDFYVPNDFLYIIAAVIWVRAGHTVANVDIDLNSQYGAQGEDYNAFTEADNVITFDFIANQWNAMDVSSVLTGIAAGDFITVRQTQQQASPPTLAFARTYGLQLRYA